MPTANEQIMDSVLQRRVYMEKYTQQVQDQIQRMLDNTEPAVRSAIEAQLTALVTADGSFDSFSDTTNAALAALASKIIATRSDAIDNGFSVLGQDLTKLAPSEAQFIDNTVNDASPVVLDTTLPSATLLAAIGATTPFEGRILSDWASSLAYADQQRIMDAINIGMAHGDTTDDIVRSVLGTSAMNGADGVTETTRRDAASITQTAIATTANDARAAYTDANSDVMGQEIWVATLDGDTCIECADLDGEVFDVGDGDEPPLHYNCRCVRVPTLDGEAIGDRPATTATEDSLAGLSEDDRAAAVQEMTGTVPASMTYQDWLGQQSAEFQDNVLGPTRGEMFRAGDMTLDKFVGSDGNMLTLDQLNEATGVGNVPLNEVKASSLLDVPAGTIEDQLASVYADAPEGAAEATATAQAQLADSVATDSLISDGGFMNADGTWTDERVALHDKILQDIFTPDAVAAAAADDTPTLTLLGGRGGSGKGWLTGAAGLVDTSNAIMLNADMIQESLPGYAGWNAANFHEEASAILSQAETYARDNNLNVIIDGTMRSADSSLARAEAFSKAGYNIDGYYMYLSPQDAASRALGRFVRGGVNGRFVPPEYSLKGLTNEQTFDSLKSYFDNWQIYDNSGRSPVLVGSSG